MTPDELLIHRELEYLRAAAAVAPRVHVSRGALAGRRQRAVERWTKLQQARREKLAIQESADALGVAR